MDPPPRPWADLSPSQRILPNEVPSRSHSLGLRVVQPTTLPPGNATDFVPHVKFVANFVFFSSSFVRAHRTVAEAGPGGGG